MSKTNSGAAPILSAKVQLPGEDNLGAQIGRRLSQSTRNSIQRGFATVFHVERLLGSTNAQENFPHD